MRSSRRLLFGDREERGGGGVERDITTALTREGKKKKLVLGEKAGDIVASSTRNIPMELAHTAGV